jgi:hypothetical protein
MSACDAGTARIIPFAPPRRVANRLTLHDRIDVAGWSNDARELGYTRVALDNSASDDEPELGDFLLVYAREKMWASWGVGCCDGGFIVWRPSDGATVGWYPTVKRALSSIPPVA